MGTSYCDKRFLFSMLLSCCQNKSSESGKIKAVFFCLLILCFINAEIHLGLIYNYCMMNKNPEIDIGVQAERSEKQNSQPLESSYIYKIFRLE